MPPSGSTAPPEIDLDAFMDWQKMDNLAFLRLLDTHQARIERMYPIGLSDEA